MYDPKFEKAIQQKMEELEFHPPEAVWVNIEKAVMVKRRRRVGFFWRYLLPGVFVVAAAGLYFYYSGKTTAKPAVNNSLTSRPVSTAARVVDQVPPGPAPTIALCSSFRHPARTSNNSRFGAGRETSAGRQTSVDAATGTAGDTQIPDETPDPEQGSVMEQGSGMGQGSAMGQTGHGQAQIAAQKGLSAWFYLPGLADQRMTAEVKGSALNTKKSNTVAVAGLSHPQRRWEAGFIAGAGVSRLNQLNNNQLASVAAASPSTSYTALSYQGGSSKHYVSDVRPGASFEGGIYLQRALSDRWIFNTGMNLHYFSNRISIGQQVTTYVQSSASLFIPSANAYNQSSSMYTAGNSQSYVNKFYFLELPVGLQWKINKSHLIPIFVEGGVSLSRLMGASALLYDGKSGLYTKDGDLANKTQFNIESALLIGLPFHGINIQLGPQIQYGLTPLVNTQGVGDQHLLYTGVRLVIIPGRK